MREYNGNKTLLPLIPKASHLEGEKPILVHIIESLPEGPKAVIVKFKKEDVFQATQNMGLAYCEQPELNGTGGALLVTNGFLENVEARYVIITMGDVPFVKPRTYQRLIDQLHTHNMVVLGFVPENKKQYGVLEVSDDCVNKITEWKYWSSYTSEVQTRLNICNSGIYAVKKEDLLRYLPILASRPQKIHKEINGKLTEIEEFFITDIVEYMVKDGLSVGYITTEDEIEAMGVDDLSALKKAQEMWKTKRRRNSV